MVMSAVDQLTDAEWLLAFQGQWHLLSDLSFSDLLLWVPDDDSEDCQEFTCVAQIRPVTGPTALEDDVIGERISYEPEHQVLVAFLSHEICETGDNALSAGIPVDVWAVPILRGGRCIAVLERHTNQMGMRATGSLEENYLEAADIFTSMILEGRFPLAPVSDKALAPRVCDGVLRVQPSGRISYASPNAITAFRRLGALGDVADEDFPVLIRSVMKNVESVGQTVQSDLAEQRSVVFDVEQPRASMRLVVLPLVVQGERQGTLVLCRDTTDLRSRDRMLVTKDATIREIHHRVKNNLQTVAALLRMQARRLKSEEGYEALTDAMRRVSSIALVHDTLSHSITDDVAFDAVCDRILRMVGDLAATSGTVEATRDGSFGEVRAEAATSLGMVITELCQNAIEHGLGSGSGRLVVHPHRDDQHLLVDVIDDGVGLPDGFRLGNQKSLGLAIISTLVGDLGGTLEIGPAESGTGTRARLVLPSEV
ncbi:ATPase [Arachnia propionica]|uniref:histidine kinase n=1 Tax=Arachnia propionica TaxID=1750 RepID=A0A3P1TCD9_9ACTN|nr:sensor histidine kinase [Arachnia propionica]MDO5082559.1 sensor histidine kinase [Arachnia propionica]RRD07054.1 ATPase [Arachnia propionica]